MTTVQQTAIDTLNTMIRTYTAEVVETESKIDALIYLKGLVYKDEYTPAEGE